MRSLGWLHLVGIAVVLTAAPALAEPLSEPAAVMCNQLRDLLRMPKGRRQLSAAQVSPLMAALKDGPYDHRVGAALLLGHAHGEESAVALRAAVSSKDEFVAGAAAYSLRLRSVAADSEDGPDFGQLAFWLGKATNRYEKMFIASRLALDHPAQQVAQLLLTAAGEEADKGVQCDMLFHILALGDSALRERAKVVTWDESYWPPEALAFVLGSLSPARS